jgi:anti-sigma B factor antagonist
MSPAPDAASGEGAAETKAMNRVVSAQGITVIELGPRYESLDQASLMEFGGLLLSEASHADPPLLVLDLIQTSYVGSSSIELLVRAWKRLKARDGTMALCGVQPFCAEVFEVTRLNGLWATYATRETALSALAASLTS